MTEQTKPDAAKPTNLIDEKLFRSRNIIIAGPINQDVTRSVSERLLALAGESDDDVFLYINSPGGHVESGDTIHDLVKFIGPQVKVIGTGWVASMGAIIYLAAERENRFCLPNTRFMLHQPAGGAGGPAADIAIQAREIVKTRERLNRIIEAGTGQPYERVEKDTDRDFWMNAEEALDYGIVGKVITSAAEILPPRAESRVQEDA
jgi:ATP-dependent Clp protease protease subunit